MKTFDLFNTLATARTSLKAGEVPVEDHIPIMENIAKVHPEDLIVSDYYNPDKAQQVIRQVCGLNNKWIVTGNGKETGKVWNGITSEGHLGDNPQTDIASAQAHGIPATLSTLHLQTPQEIKCGEIGWAMRAARLTTWNADPELRGLQLHQIERNYPFILKAAYELDRIVKRGGYKRILCCSRDCCHLYEAMKRIAVGYEVVYFFGSRVTRYRPNDCYEKYARNLLKDALVVDLTGTGNSLKYMCDKFGGTPMLVTAWGPCAVPSLAKGGINEHSNMDIRPTVYGIDPAGVPLYYNPKGIDWECPQIKVMHEAFKKALDTGISEPSPSFQELLITMPPKTPDPALNCLKAIHLEDSKAMYDYLKSGPLPHDVIC